MFDNKNISYQTELVKPKEIKISRKFKHLERIDERLLGYLCGMRDMYRRQKRLMPNGSFYKTNEELFKILGIADSTFHRSKRRLQEQGLIKCENPLGRGRATVYLILDTLPEELKSEPPKEEERPPLDLEAVKSSERLSGRDYALKFWQRRGYSAAEISAALEG